MKIAIIGSGLMGRVLALTLLMSKQAITIDLFEKDQKNGQTSCGFQAAGMLAPISELINCHSQIYQLGKKSILSWQNIDLFLAQRIKQKKSIVDTTGTLLIAHKNEKNEFFEALKTIEFRLNEVKAQTDQFEILNNQQIKDIEPDIDTLSLHQQMAQIKNEAVINVKEFFIQSTKVLDQAKEINWICETEISSIDQLNRKNKKYEKYEKSEKHDFIFDCRGLKAENNLDQLYGVKGEAIIVYQPQIKLKHVVRLLHPRFPLYLIPRGDGIFYLGATSIQSAEKSAISVESLMSLLSSLFIIDKRFAEARVIKTISHLRPTSFNDLAIVKESKFNKNYIYLNGLSRHGFLFSPKIALDMVNLIQQKIKKTKK